MWPSVVVHEHWPVSQRMIVEMGDYAWSEHIVTVFLACQITIRNVQVQLTVKGKTTPHSYTPTPKSSCAQNDVFRCRQIRARPSVGCSKKTIFIRPLDPSPCANSPLQMIMWPVKSSIGDDVMSTVDVLWVVALAFPDDGGVWLQCVCYCGLQMLNYQLYWTAVAAPVWIWAGPLSASFCEVYLHVDGQ